MNGKTNSLLNMSGSNDIKYQDTDWETINGGDTITVVGKTNVLVNVAKSVENIICICLVEWGSGLDQDPNYFYFNGICWKNGYQQTTAFLTITDSTIQFNNVENNGYRCLMLYR